MSKRKTKICLITPGHLSSTPRLIREANALSEAGHEVVVIAGSYHPPSIELDRSLLRSARWQYVGVSISQLNRISLRFLAWGNRLFSRNNLEAAFLGAFPFSALLLSKVLDVAAETDLFLGHTMPGLYVAKEAARLSRAKAGFDIEDYHPEEEVEIAQNRSRKRVAYRAMKKWLPLCRHLTAASPLIAEKCRQEFGIRAVTILNTYPLEDAPVNPVGPRGEVQFYWFSQTIGPGRGLEDFIFMMSAMETPSELILRGMISNTYLQHLRKITKPWAKHRLRVLDPCPPEKIVSACAGHTFGLCLENDYPMNRDLCLPNKIFAYLLAGTPVILSPTTAHRKLALELGSAAVVLDQKLSLNEKAKQIDEILSNTHYKENASSTALRLGRSVYNWDTEKIKLMMNTLKS